MSKSEKASEFENFKEELEFRLWAPTEWEAICRSNIAPTILWPPGYSRSHATTGGFAPCSAKHSLVTLSRNRVRGHVPQQDPANNLMDQKKT